MKTNPSIRILFMIMCGVGLGVRADVVTDWNTLALNAIRTDRTPPPRASRALAILHIAIFDAVNGVKERPEQKFKSYRVTGHARGNASEEAAASAAAHRVLTTLFPGQQVTFDSAYAAALARTADHKKRGDDDDSSHGRSKRRGVEWGEYVAQVILAERALDGSGAVVPPPSGSGPGVWQPTPPANAPYLLPQWGFVMPFATTSPSQFRPPGPPALDSARYAADCNEVNALGRATDSARTADQDQIALFWADGAGTETPPGHWNSIAQDVARAQGNTTDENARLFALLNIAMADAAICAWDAKYTFNFWRPVTAIRQGETDDNPLTDPDPTWSSFIVTPPFPDYVSGHSTFSGAASMVLALFYGTDNLPFTTGSDFLPGVIRPFNSFSAAAEEAADSRLYGGIHFRFANEDGLQSGLGIGQWTFTHYLQPKGKRSR